MSPKKKQVLILGSRGFIGSHLVRHLNKNYSVNCAGLESSYDELAKLVFSSDFIIHSLGVTRSNEESDFFSVNIDFSYRVFTLLMMCKNKLLIYFSSIHFFKGDIYGFSKRYNEYLFSKVELISRHQSFIIRTPGIFGPGAKANNVSVVSTFCNNFVNNAESIINNPDKELNLLYIDDLVLLVERLFKSNKNFEFVILEGTKISVINLYLLIEKIAKNCPSELNSDFDHNFIRDISITYNSFSHASKQGNLNR